MNTPATTLWPWLLEAWSKKADAELIGRLAVEVDNPALVIEDRAGRGRGIIAIRVNGMRATLAVGAVDRRFWCEACAAEALALMVSAAFRMLPLQRIELIIFASCKGAIECACTAGFREEGVLRRCRRSEKIFEDCVVMSVLRT